MSKKNRKNRNNNANNNSVIALGTEATVAQPKLTDFQKFVLSNVDPIIEQRYQIWKRQQEEAAEFEALRIAAIKQTDEANKKQQEEAVKTAQAAEAQKAINQRNASIAKKAAERRQMWLDVRAGAFVFCVYLLPMGLILMSAMEKIFS